MISRRIWYLNLHDWKLHRRFTGFNSTVFWVSHRCRWDVVKNWRSKHTATLAPMNATCTLSSFKSSFTPILTSHAQSKVFCQPAWTCLPGVLPFFTPNLKIEIDWKGAVRCLLMCPNMSKPYIWDHNCQRRLALARKEIGWFPTRRHKNSMKWQGRQPCHVFQDSWRDHTWPQSHANFWHDFSEDSPSRTPWCCDIFPTNFGTFRQKVPGLSSPAPRKTTPGLEGLGTMRVTRPMCESGHSQRCDTGNRGDWNGWNILKPSKVGSILLGLPCLPHSKVCWVVWFGWNFSQLGCTTCGICLWQVWTRHIVTTCRVLSFCRCMKGNPDIFDI